MAKYSFSVTRQGVVGDPVRAVNGDLIYFVADGANPPPASGSLVVTSDTHGVTANQLFDRTHVALRGNEVCEQVRARPGRDQTFYFEVGPDWGDAVAGQGGGEYIPTKGKINVGSGGGQDG